MKERIALKENSSYILSSVIILGFALLVGSILSLIVGLRLDKFIWISPRIVIIDSFSLGIAMLLNFHFTRYLVTRTKNTFLMLLLSVGTILGIAILTFIFFFLSNPISFLYTENRNITYLLVNLLFFIAISIITCGFVIFQHKVLEREKALNEETVLKKEMELKLLASKVNPHFLFNSLNLVISLLKHPEKAEIALINLSEILRYQLDLSDARTVPLESELKIVDQYLSIQKMRFGDRLNYRIDCQTTGEIPPLVIQPLVENCIKHNIDASEQLTIDLTISKENNRIVIYIVDSAARLTSDMPEKGIGLTTTRKRIEYMNGSFMIKDGGILLSFEP